MNTRYDSGGWGDAKLLIGPRPKDPDDADWAKRSAAALAAAKTARTSGTNHAAGRWRLDAGDVVYGAGVAYGKRGLVDGVLAFTDGERSVLFRGFTARVETDDGSPAPEPAASIREEKGTLRVSWSIPGAKRDAAGFPRIVDLAVGPASDTPHRVYLGFGNVIEGPKRFSVRATGFLLSTRHVGADYLNGLSVVHAVDVVPDSADCDGARNIFSLHAHHDAIVVKSERGDFRAVPGVVKILAPVFRSPRSLVVARIQANHSRHRIDSQGMDRIRHGIQHMERVGIVAPRKIRIAFAAHIHRSHKGLLADTPV